MNDEMEDPFHPNNIGALNFIMMARVYDLLMLDLNARNPEVANKVLEVHKRGGLLGPPPIMNGEFGTDSESK